MKLTKPYIRIFLFIVLTSSIVWACKKDNTTTPPVSDVDLKKGLLLYLPFDGNMADSSGNGNTTSVVGGATLTYDEHGYASSAYGATGSGQKLIVTNNGSIKFDTAYSVSLNFMIRSFRTQTFLSMVNEATGYGPTFALGTHIPGSTHFNFTSNDSTESCNYFGSETPQQAADLTPFEPQVESWYNAVCIYHKGSVTVYINGKLINTVSSTGTKALLCPNAQIVVGGWWSQDPLSIDGKLDEIRMYNRVLNADEIAELAKDFQNN